MGCHPNPIDSYFSRWLFNHQPGWYVSIIMIDSLYIIFPLYIYIYIYYNHITISYTHSVCIQSHDIPIKKPPCCDIPLYYTLYPIISIIYNHYIPMISHYIHLRELKSSAPNRAFARRCCWEARAFWRATTCDPLATWTACWCPGWSREGFVDVEKWPCENHGKHEKTRGKT